MEIVVLILLTLFLSSQQRLSLNVMTLKVTSPKVYTVQGVPLSVTGIAQVNMKKYDNLLLNKLDIFHITSVNFLGKNHKFKWGDAASCSRTVYRQRTPTNWGRSHVNSWGTSGTKIKPGKGGCKRELGLKMRKAIP